jgi:hypothetical protein
VTIQVDPKTLYDASDFLVNATSGIVYDRKAAATASVNVWHTGTPESDTAQADAGLAMAEAVIRHENSMKQLGVNLGLASVAYDTTDYKASFPTPPKIDHSQPSGPVA